MNDAQGAIPEIRHALENRIEIRASIAFDQGGRRFGGTLFAEQQPQLERFTGIQADFRLQRAAGVQAAADPVAQRLRPQERRRLGERTMAPDELGSIGRAALLPARHVHEGNPRFEIRRPGIARQEGARG